LVLRDAPFSCSRSIRSNPADSESLNVSWPRLLTSMDDGSNRCGMPSGCDSEKKSEHRGSDSDISGDEGG
jgi:hypothetical protein